MKREKRVESEKGFGKNLHIRLTDKEYEQVCRYAKEQNTTVSEIVRRSVRLYNYQMEKRKYLKE